MKKPILFIIIILLLGACKAPMHCSSPIVKPENIEFVTANNYKAFKTIQLPSNGDHFKANTDNADSDFPTITYHGAPLIIWASLKDFEGTLEEQFEEVKTTFSIEIKENTEIDFSKEKIGKHEVAKFKIYRPYGDSGYASLQYGYLIKHDKQAAIIMQKDGYITPETDKAKYIKIFDKGIRYSISTLEFTN